MKITQITDDIQVLEPDYVSITSMVEAFSKLYEVAGDKKAVDKLINSISEPNLKQTYLLSTNPDDVKNLQELKKQLKK